ncbi:TetR/AcrR family transcriptional regulator C-terminal domain-containing protein [Streptomyces sp. NPDC058773]|uniref:TetR/AcrR family transcriptional regulator C-terminal domain-containing protein n=1 Tax=Streptomyces sp. NPDC058773 TaxID=3346632 RepID=UPI00367E1332
MVSRIDRRQVVDAALRLLNEVGLEGLTLRRIAKELNVQAPALYWHFKNKQELIDEMATAMFRQLAVSLAWEGGELTAAGRPWQDTLREAGRGLRRELLGYRDGGKVFSGTRMTDESYARPLENLLTHLTGAGFTLRQAVQAWLTLYNFTVGLVIEEQSIHPDPVAPEHRDPAYDMELRSEKIGVGYPLAAMAGEEMFGDMDRNFEAGLRIIIAGIEVTVGPEQAS